MELTQYDDMKTEDQIIMKELQNASDNAIKTCILGKACDARDELLGKLFMDQRIQTANCVYLKMLKDMHQHRIISAQNQEDFGKILPLKDQLKLIGEYTILQKAIFEHNMRVIARLYKNINIKDLAVLLGVSMENAEKLAHDMIQEKRLKGTIDQMENQITFDEYDGLRSWEDEIKQILVDLNECVEMIKETNTDLLVID